MPLLIRLVASTELANRRRVIGRDDLPGGSEDLDRGFAAAQKGVASNARGMPRQPGEPEPVRTTLVEIVVECQEARRAITVLRPIGEARVGRGGGTGTF